MKRFLKLFLLLLAIVTFDYCNREENKPDSEPEWQWEIIPVVIQKPYLTFWKIEFYNNDFGVICGDSGIILKTDNGGEEWQTLCLERRTELNNLFILNQKEFYIGTDSLYKTNDGGDTFTTLSKLGHGYFRDIHFFNSNTGFILKPGGLYKTTDGGQSWDSIFIDQYVSNMQFVNDSVGYIFDLIGLPNGSSFGEFHKTTDQGNTWSPSEDIPGVSDKRIQSMYFLNEDTGYFTTLGFDLFFTQNGGISWTKRCDFTLSSMDDLVFLSEKVGYGASYFGILKTEDGGFTWNWDYQNHIPITSVAKTPDNKKVIAVGGGGYVLMRR